jgi:hypothetical protein
MGTTTDIRRRILLRTETRLPMRSRSLQLPQYPFFRLEDMMDIVLVNHSTFTSYNLREVTNPLVT